MKIITKTNNGLVMRERSRLSSILWGLMWGLIGGIPLILLLTNLGVESLKCQRIASDRVDCTQTRSTAFGGKQLAPQSFPFVTQAEYKYSAIPGDKNCPVIHHHNFDIVFRDGSHQTIFKYFIQGNCHKGNQAWIQTQVASLNQFIASETGTIEIVYDNRFTVPILGMMLLYSLFILIGWASVLTSVLPIDLYLDKSKIQLFWRRKKCYTINLRFPASSSQQMQPEANEEWIESSDEMIYMLFKEHNFDNPLIKLIRRLGIQSIIEMVMCKNGRLPIGSSPEKPNFIPVSSVSQSIPSAKAMDSARRLLDHCQAIYSQRHELIRVNPGNFSKIDLGFYESTQRLLEKRGFQKLADIEDVTVTQANGGNNRTLIRVMLDRNSRTLAIFNSIQQSFLIKVFQAIGLLVKGGNVIELKSGFNDGKFLVTNNLKNLDPSGDVPGIYHQRYPSHTTIDDLMTAHTKTLDDLTSRKQPVYLYTYEDMLEFEHFLQDLTNWHKQRQGYITRDDIRQVVKNGLILGWAVEELWTAIEAVKDSGHGYSVTEEEGLEVMELFHRLEELENRHKQRQGYVTCDDIRRMDKTGLEHITEELWALIEDLVATRAAKQQTFQCWMLALLREAETLSLLLLWVMLVQTGYVPVKKDNIDSF